MFPARNYLPLAQCEPQWLATLVGRVELAPWRSCPTRGVNRAYVVYRDLNARLGQVLYGAICRTIVDVSLQLFGGDVLLEDLKLGSDEGHHQWQQARGVHARTAT